MRKLKLLHQRGKPYQCPLCVEKLLPRKEQFCYERFLCRKHLIGYIKERYLCEGKKFVHERYLWDKDLHRYICNFIYHKEINRQRPEKVQFT
jgi:hypothetical protein